MGILRDFAVNHPIAYGFTGSVVFVTVAILVIPWLRREAFTGVRAVGRALRAAYLNQPRAGRATASASLAAADPRSRAARRMWMDTFRRETAADRRWMENECADLSPIADLFADEEAQR
jgi:hypothetical protein